MSPHDPSTPQPPPPPPARTAPDIGASLTWAWHAFRANLTTLLCVHAVVFTVGAALWLPPYVWYLRTLVLTDEPYSFASVDWSRVLSVGAVLLGVALLVMPIISSNLARISLMVLDGEHPRVRDLFVLRRAGAALGTGWLLALGTLVGYVLCFLPAIVFAWGAAFSYYLLHDRGIGPAAAIGASFRLVRHNLGPALVAILLGSLIAAGTFACWIGVIATAPIGSLFIAHQYRWIGEGRSPAVVPLSRPTPPSGEPS